MEALDSCHKDHRLRGVRGVNWEMHLCPYLRGGHWGVHLYRGEENAGQLMETFVSVCTSVFLKTRSQGELPTRGTRGALLAAKDLCVSVCE